jgi:hypothetical protein
MHAALYPIAIVTFLLVTLVPAPVAAQRVATPKQHHAFAVGTAVPKTALAPSPRPEWLPYDADERVPPVSADAACSVSDVLAGVGWRIEQLAENVNRFSATETLSHQKVDRSGRLRRPEVRNFDYVASIAPITGGRFSFREYRDRIIRSREMPGLVATLGTPSIAFIFHPLYAGGFHMTCEGLGQWKGEPAWQVRFEEREDEPYRISRVVVGGRSYGARLRGRAWILAGNYQLARLETDLAAPLPEAELYLQHEKVEYQPVYFPQRGIELWLPSSVELYMDFRGHQFLRRHSFNDFELFSVDVHQQLGRPRG